MAVLPIQGLQQEGGNPYEQTIVDMRDISIENGQYRNRRDDKVINSNLSSSIQSFAFPPNTTDPETQRVLLDTPYYAYWRDKLIANRFVNGEPVFHAYHVNDLAGKPFYRLQPPTIQLVDRTFDTREITSAEVGPVGGTPVSLSYNPTRQGFYRDNISVSSPINYQATFFFTPDPSSTTVDLSNYNSLMIRELEIKGSTELDWDTVLFTLILEDDTEVLCDFITWGSRTGNLFFDNDNVSYADLRARQLEIDISSVVRNKIKALRIQWIAGRNQGNFSPARTWSVFVSFYLREGASEYRYPRLNGQFSTGLQTWAAVFSSQHQNTLYQELLVRSSISDIKYQVVGLGTRWTSNRFIVEANPQNIQPADVYTTNPNDRRVYHLVLARTEGNQWLEVFERECFVDGKGRSRNTTAIPLSGPTTVTLSHNIWVDPHIAPTGRALLFDPGSGNREVVRYERFGTSNNQIQITARGTPSYAFPVNSHVFFLTYAITLHNEPISRALAIGGQWFYGLTKQLDSRLLIANPLTGEMALSTTNAPFLFPHRSLRVGDGFRVFLGDLPYAMEPTAQGIQVYTLNFTYRVLFGENERSTVIQRYYAAKPRSNISSHIDFFVGQEGLFQGNQLIFEADYTEPVAQKPSAIFFDGFRILWSYGDMLYSVSPTEQGVVKYQLPGTILWIQTFGKRVFCLIANSPTQRSFIEVEGLTTRKTNGWIRYGKLAKSNLFRLFNVAIWGRDIHFRYQTPRGITERQMNYEGEMVIDTHQPSAQLTHELEFEIRFPTQNSRVARIEIDLEESPARKIRASQ